VDLVQGTIAVRRSYDHESTKGNHADLIPIAAQLRPYLAEAMLASRSQYVYPADDGSMRRGDTKLQSVLRRALARAGMVLGYRQVCRRKGCGHLEETPDRALRCCPRCRMKLWPKAIQRSLRFHDLRGTTATLLARSGVGLVIAQRILRHSDPRLTANIYSRVDLADLQAGNRPPRHPARGAAVGSTETPSKRALAAHVGAVRPGWGFPPGQRRRRARGALTAPWNGALVPLATAWTRGTWLATRWPWVYKERLMTTHGCDLTQPNCASMSID
jgi:hypothetical protein